MIGAVGLYNFDFYIKKKVWLFCGTNIKWKIFYFRGSCMKGRTESKPTIFCFWSLGKFCCIFLSNFSDCADLFPKFYNTWILRILQILQFYKGVSCMKGWIGSKLAKFLLPNPVEISLLFQSFHTFPKFYVFKNPTEFLKFFSWSWFFSLHLTTLEFSELYILFRSYFTETNFFSQFLSQEIGESWWSKFWECRANWVKKFSDSYLMISLA